MQLIYGNPVYTTYMLWNDRQAVQRTHIAWELRNFCVSNLFRLDSSFIVWNLSSIPICKFFIATHRKFIIITNMQIYHRHICKFIIVIHIQIYHQHTCQFFIDTRVNLLLSYICKLIMVTHENLSILKHMQIYHRHTYINLSLSYICKFIIDMHMQIYHHNTYAYLSLIV